MNALLLTFFVSTVLASLAILSFLYGVKQKEHEHADRLSLLPLEDDEGAAVVDPERSSDLSSGSPELSPAGVENA